MRKLVTIALAGMLALAAAPLGNAAQVEDARAEDAQLFVGGGTPLTNGVFFPGTGVYDGDRYQYLAPLEVTKGSNVVLTNVDESIVTNIHQIRSLKRNKKTKRPLFSSKPVRRPGDSVTIRTKKLKPGKYEYECTTHAGMQGMLQIVKG